MVRPGDTVTTGSDGWITFVVGQDAFFLRARTEIRLERGIAGGREVARQENHTDEEMDGLERLVGRRAPWVR